MTAYTVMITETIVYRHTYDREELVTLWPALAKVPESEVAAYLVKERPAAIEEHLSDHFGEVDGTAWRAEEAE